jgi:xanthine dehydrogenase YagS FAD-binding subunit
MNPFDFRLVDSVEEASRAGGPGKAFKAGGIDLLDRLKERVENPGELIDLLRLQEQMGGIQQSAAGAVRIGALATLAEIGAAEPLAAPGFHALREAAGDAASPQIRSRATLGGNLLQRNRCWYYRSAGFECAHDGKGSICLANLGDHRYHAVLGAIDCIRVHPSNTAPALVVLGAEVEAQRGDQTRRLPIRALFPDKPSAEAPEHTLAEDEVLTAVLLPAAAAQGRSAYRETREKQSFDWATTAAAAHLKIEGGKIATAAVCLGAVAPVPWWVDAERLVGQAPSRELFEDFARRAFRRAQPLAQNAYKIEVGQACLTDALLAAAGEDDR